MKIKCVVVEIDNRPNPNTYLRALRARVCQENAAGSVYGVDLLEGNVVRTEDLARQTVQRILRDKVEKIRFV